MKIYHYKRITEKHLTPELIARLEGIASSLGRKAEEVRIDCLNAPNRNGKYCFVELWFELPEDYMGPRALPARAKFSASWKDALEAAVSNLEQRAADLPPVYQPLKV